MSYFAVADRDVVRALAKQGGHARIARYGGRAATEPARTAFLERFRQQVDPENTLDPADREQRAHAALRAHMASLRVKRLRALRETPR